MIRIAHLRVYGIWYLVFGKVVFAPINPPNTKYHIPNTSQGGTP
jgi:hypothetical protein